MAIIFFALAAVLILVVLFMSLTNRNRNKVNDGWERPSMSDTGV